MRNVVASYAEEYSQASTKDAKSTIVSAVVDEIESHGSGFVKQQNGSWHCVTFSHAREKISQAFRDLLHNRYKSSIDTRRKARQAKKRQRGEEPSHRPAKKLHSISSNNNDDKGKNFPMEEFDANRRTSYLWLEGKEAMLDLDDDEMDWLSKPDEIFSIASAFPELCCSDTMVTQPEFGQRRDSHILPVLEDLEALEGNFFDDEPTNENQELFRGSIVMLQKIMPREFDSALSLVEPLALVQEV